MRRLSELPKSKVCSRCGVEKQAAEFSVKSRKDRNGGKPFLYSACTECERAERKRSYYKNRDSVLERSKQAYAENPQKFIEKSARTRDKEKAKEYGRAYNLQKLYDLTVEQYNEMLESQNRLCAICHSECTSGRRLAVDHSHDTGLVRGLLCGRCNTMLGRVEENVEILKNMVRYLEDHAEAP